MPGPYFNATRMPNAQNEYVLWIDIMGTKSNMSNGVKSSSIFISKLHVAILESKTDGLKIYPVMDGAYVTSVSEDEMNTFIINVYKRLMELFVETEDRYKFIAKGALAYGPVIHGKDIGEGCNTIFRDNRAYMNSILFGQPMIQAAKSETFAAPFGIYCDETARQVSDVFCHRWYKWYLQGHGIDITQLKVALKNYYSYVEKHSYEIDYSKDRIKEHKEKCYQYFDIDD